MGMYIACQLHSARPLIDDIQAALESNGEIQKADALALASVNVEKLLGIKTDSLQGDLVATHGGDLLDFSKVVGVISPRRGLVDIF